MIDVGSAWYLHSSFGLTLRSRLSWLPAPLITEVPADLVEVEIGAQLPALPADAASLPRFEARPGHFVFRTRTIANFTVEGGASVLVQPRQGCEPLKLANLLLGGVAGALLLQRGQLALHGCSVECGDGAVVFVGPSGAGKSTLATLLRQRDMRILDDNIAALRSQGQEFLVQPGSGHVKMSRAALHLVRELPCGPFFAQNTTEKALLPVASPYFCMEARPLREIFVLDRARPRQFEPVYGADKVLQVQRQIFFRQLAEPLGQAQLLFQKSLALARRVPVTLLGMPEVSVEQWADAVVQRLAMA